MTDKTVEGLKYSGLEEIRRLEENPKPNEASCSVECDSATYYAEQYGNSWE